MVLDRLWNVSGGLVFYPEILEFIDRLAGFYGKQLRFVHSVYDCHGGLIWEGGRKSIAGFSLEESVRRVKAYNARGIGFNIAFTNVLLTREHLDDPYCNWFLDQCHSEENGVIVASDLLRDHIRKNYPKYRLIASVCYCRKDLEFYQKAQKEFDLVVLHPDLNRDYGFIRRLDPARLEVLVNEDCFYNCPNRLQHYKNISELVLRKEPVFFASRAGCLSEKQFGRSRFEGELRLSLQNLSRLSALGVRHFKLQGRQASWSFMEEEMINYIEKGTIREIIRAWGQTSKLQ